jgi:hypothetical protein
MLVTVICYDDAARMFAANGFILSKMNAATLSHFSSLRLISMLCPLPCLHRFQTKTSVCISHLSHERYMPHPLHPICVDYHNNDWVRVHIMTLLIMQCFLLSYHYIYSWNISLKPCSQTSSVYHTIFYTSSSWDFESYERKYYLKCWNWCPLLMRVEIRWLRVHVMILN